MTVAAAAPPTHRTESGLPAAAVAVLMWGIGPLLVRAIDADVYAFTLYRLALAVPVMWIAARVAGQRVDRAVARASLVPGVLFGTSMLAGFAAIRTTSVANATLITALVPAVVLLGAGRLVGERTDWDRVPAAVVALAGLSLVVLTGGAASGATLRGDLLAFASLILFTGYFLALKNVRDAGVGSGAFLVAVFAVSVVIVCPVCLVASDDVGALDTSDWLLVVAIVVGPGLVGHGLMAWASAHLPITTSSLLTLASPVVSTLGAWLVYDQRLGVWQLIGSGLVLAGLTGILVGAGLSARRRPLLS